MTKQKFSDWGTEFDLDNIKGNVTWGGFLDHLKAGGRGRVVRLRYLGDRVIGRTFVFDLSYMYVEMAGEVYDCRDFPVWNISGSRGVVRKAVYQVCKAAGVWPTNIFGSISEHV